MTAPSDLARVLADLTARSQYETLCTVTARTGGELSRSCDRVQQTLVLLQVAVETGEYHRLPVTTRRHVAKVSEHVMRKHPEHWHLFFEPPTAAQRALQDQLAAAHREASEQYGPSAPLTGRKEA